MRYEAVHPIEGFSDLQSRFGPHRRCFVFLHEAMAREPLVVVYVAFMDSIPSSIQERFSFTQFSLLTLLVIG